MAALPLAAGLTLLFIELPRSAAQSAGSSPSVGSHEVIESYCTGCHNAKARAGGLNLQKDLSLPADAETWEKVVRKLNMRSMPPQGMPRPTEAEYDAAADYLEQQLDQAAAADPDPGEPLLHRLNRTEYANVIHDLLGLDVNVEDLLPADDSAFGFDNVASVLGVSPVLLERYLSAADRISGLAVGDPESQPGATTYRNKQDLSQDQHIEGLPFGTVGGMLIHHNFPLDGEYEFQVNIFRNNLEIMRGIELPHQLEVSVDGERIFTDAVGGADDLAKMRNPTNGSDEIDSRLHVRVPVTAGEHDVVVTFLQKRAVSTIRLQGFQRSSVDTFEAVGRPHIEMLTITGPFEATGPGNTASRHKIFTCRPTQASEEEACAREILGTLARRAFRRPVTDVDMAPVMQFYAKGRRKGSFDSGIQMGLRRILASPAFVFRPEESPDDLQPGTLHRISDIELASRLSFFLWSSIPDDELMDLAAADRLHEPAMLRAQTERMLHDPKAKRFVENFAGQWLQLRNLRNARPNSADFPDFDDNLRQGFRQETEMFFASILNENRNVLDLLRADYTFVNERLARHYGIPGIYGSNFRRVKVAQDERRGLLGQGSILTVTSHADRTSPVVRGKWILENLLASPPPPPPPNVPQLPENAEGDIPKSLRARLELHRASPVCASCHSVMDPIGFALDNFDAVGAWRTQESGQPIDSTAKLSDGTQVDGVVSLREALLARPNLFISAVTEKLLIYSLGRGLNASDMPTVRRIVREAAAEDYSLSSLIEGVVESTPFQMRKKPGEEPDPRRPEPVSRK